MGVDDIGPTGGGGSSGVGKGLVFALLSGHATSLVVVVDAQVRQVRSLGCSGERLVASG